jgi:AcrR family transcriptional regulator
VATTKLKRVELLVERPSTKAHLIDVSEELFGLYGLDGISLREIAASAGQANANAVQYHFKDKRGLIQAILKDRMLRRETLRREMLLRLVAENKQTNPRDLFAAMILPTLAFHNERSGHVFCRFLLQCYIHPDSGYDDTEELYEALLNARKANEKGEQLAIVQITDLMQAQFEDMPPHVLMSRLKAAHLMFMASVVEFDNAQKAGKRRGEFDAAPILDMSVAALSAHYKRPSRRIAKASARLPPA